MLSLSLVISFDGDCKDREAKGITGWDSTNKLGKDFFISLESQVIVVCRSKISVFFFLQFLSIETLF